MLKLYVIYVINMLFNVYKIEIFPFVLYKQNYKNIFVFSLMVFGMQPSLTRIVCKPKNHNKLNASTCKFVVYRFAKYKCICNYICPVSKHVEFVILLHFLDIDIKFINGVLATFTYSKSTSTNLYTMWNNFCPLLFS